MMKHLLFILLFVTSASHMKAQDFWYYRETPPKKTNRVIATDYNECLMGIKDTLGNWIVKPQYMMIYEMAGGYFEITNYEKFGVIDPDGKLIIPMTYDRIHETFYGSNTFYTVKLDKKCGVIDRTGKVIVPCAYKSVDGNRDTTFSARKTWRQWYIFHRDGTKFRVPWKTRWGPIELDSALFIEDRGRWFLHDKYGLYDDSGHVLLKRKYFDIDTRGYQSTLVISTRKKKGYFTTDLDTIWPMIFDRGKNSYYYWGRGYYWYQSHYIMQDGVVAERLNGWIGLINMKGDTLLPFRYDFANCIGRSGNNSVWEVGLNGESGIFESGKGWIIPVSVEALDVATSFRRDSDSSYVAMFTGLKNGKYGMQTTLGEIIVPFEFESLSQNGNDWEFVNPDSMIIVNRTSRYTRHRLMVGSDTIDTYSDFFGTTYNEPHHMIPDSGRFSITVKEPGWKLYYHPGHLNDTLKHTKTGAIRELDRNRKSDFPNEQLNASVLEVRTVKPIKKLDGDAGTYYEYLVINHHLEPRLEKCVVYRRTFFDRTYLYADFVDESVKDKQYEYYWTEQGLLFRDDGKILSNREFYDCNVTILIPDSTVYFEIGWWKESMVIDGEGDTIVSHRKDVQLDDYNTRYAWIDTRPFRAKNHWRLIDAKTNKTVYDNGRSWRSHPDLVNDLLIDYESKKGWFLYKIPQKKIITKGWDDITQADQNGELFLVRSCTGKHGMINQAGNIVVDTLWNFYTPFSFYGGKTSWFDYGNDYVHGQSYRYIVFYDTKRSMVYDVVNKTTLENKNVLVDSALTTVDSITHDLVDLYQQENMVYPGTIRVYIDSATRSVLQPWHYTSIFDSVFTRKRLEYFNPDYEWSFSSFYSCQYCGKKTKRYYWPAPNHYDDINFYEVHLATENVLSMSGFDGTGTRRWYTNHVVTDAGVTPVTLQWLFDPRTDWRNYLINSVIGYVNSHLNVVGDCHNPAGLPMLLNESFLIGPNGMELYPEGFYENNAQLRILLPWNECTPYMLQSMKERMPVPKQ